jgi:hypothetical protein
MDEVHLSNEEWAVLAKARDRAKRGLRAYLSAEQADRFSKRGYMAASPRDPTQFVITGAGKLAVEKWERSRRQ